jgi:predicted RNA-binding protein
MKEAFIKRFGKFPTNPKGKKIKFKEVTFKLTSNDFKIPEHYRPPKKEILLIIPCTPEKPYSESKTHKKIKEILQDKWKRIHKVTVSGLYGPVPIEFEKKSNVLRYDYRLRSYSIFNPQKEEIIKRLREFLETHGKNYKKIIAIAPDGVYKKVINQAFKEYGRGNLFDEISSALNFISDT